jgi:tetratricopeptide (TPR) repeat protein
MAVAKGQSTENFDELDYFGYPTVSGMGCFKDEKASELYTNKYETLISENGPDFSFYEDYIDLLMEENDQFDYLNYQPSENYANNVMLFDIGNQGHFPSYFGFDVNHNPVCLVTDFLVFDDIHYYKYLAQNLKKEIEKLICSNELNNEIFSEVAASQLKHLFNNTGNFENKYKHTDLELLSDDLFNLLSKYIKTGAGAFLTLSASIELVKSYTKSPEYLVDLAIDMILVSLGEKIEFVENEKEAEEKEKINSLTYEIMELESQGLYEEAIGKINQQLILVEELNKKTFLIYDKMAVLNNKAYYLLLLKVYDEALDVINKAILEFDDAPEIYHTRAEIYFAIEKYNNALVDINKSIELAYDDSKEQLRIEILKKIKYL